MHNISLLDFGSQLAGLHIHNTYTHTHTYVNKKKQLCRLVIEWSHCGAHECRLALSAGIVFDRAPNVYLLMAVY